MSKIIKVALGILIRQDKIVYLKVPDNFDEWEDEKKKDLMGEVYDFDDGTGFSDDESWGCEEATHVLLGDAPDMDPNFSVDEEGLVSRGDDADMDLDEDGDAQEDEPAEEES